MRAAFCKLELRPLAATCVLLSLALGPACVPAKAAASAAGRVVLRLASPDHRLQAVVHLNAGGQLDYSLNLGKKPVLAASPLGIMAHDGATADWTSGITAARRSGVTTLTDDYQTHGLQRHVTDRLRQVTLTITKPGAPPLQIILRMFNDGMAFRYVFPGNEAIDYDDHSGWALPSHSTVWYQPRGDDFEGIFTSSAVENLSRRFPAPATVHLPDGDYACITDSDVNDGDHVLFLNAQAGSSALSASASGHGAQTPWRLIMVAPDLNGLVHASLLVKDLATPPDPKLFPEGADTPWVQPARSLWSWLPQDTGSPALQRHYVDAASALGFEDILVDAGWEGWSAPGQDDWAILKSLVDYAAAHQVKVWVWKHSNEMGGDAGSAFLDKVKAVGVVGVKVDFIGENITLQRAVLQEAAERSLMVDFHGANKPVGLARTFPNEMTREGIRGLEYERGGGPYPASHQLALPFTRNLAGAMDYTPGLFDQRLHTTFAFELAAGVVYTSPVTHWGISPETIDSVFPVGSIQRAVLSAMPTDWDETRVLEPSAIGEQAIFARRRGANWLLGVMRAGPAEADVPVKLSFLKKGIHYKAWLVADDGANPQAFKTSIQDVTSADTLQLAISSDGGFVAMFQPVNQPGKK